MKFNRFFTIFAATAAFGLAGAASGGTPDVYTWTAGASSADWDELGNWNCSGTCNDSWPGRNNHDVGVIIGQAGSFDPALNVNAKIGSLTIGSTGQLTFTGTGRLTVAGNAAIDGVLTVPEDLQVGGTPSATNNGDMAVGSFEVGSPGDVEVGGAFEVEAASVVPIEGLMLVQGQVELRASGGNVATVRVERGATGSKLTIEDKLMIQSNTASPFAPAVLQIGNNAGTVGGLVEMVGTGNLVNEIGGDILLTSGESLDESILRVTESMTFGPQDPGGSPVRGFVIGEDDDAMILIAAGKTLESQVNLVGQMLVDSATTSSAATLKNLWVVDANAASGTLTLGPDLDLEDVCDDLAWPWRASANGATLLFKREVLDLVGNFQLTGCSIFEFEEDVTTCGRGSFQDGEIIVEAHGTTFRVDDFGGSLGCPAACEDLFPYDEDTPFGSCE